MDEKLQQIYNRGTLTDYSFKQRLLIRSVAFVFSSLIKIIGRTLRLDLSELEKLEKLEQNGQVPILALWHQRIFGSIYSIRGRPVVILVSKSLDGEYIARALTRFGYGAVRGSSSRGGVSALVEMVRLMRRKIPVAFTVDGPRGPAQEAKPGPCLLAKKTGHPILPLSVETERFWTIKSWDTVQIPKPFSRAKLFFHEPVTVAAEADADEIEKKRLELQSKLDELTELGKVWRESIKN